MALLKIPTPAPSDFGFVYRIVLDATPFRFQFRWNERELSWVLDIGDGNGVAIVRNLRMVIGTDILAPHRALAIPQGVMNVVDTQGSNVEAERTEFGDRVQLQYTEVA